jgi:hypothetical protein
VCAGTAAVSTEKFQLGRGPEELLRAEATMAKWYMSVALAALGAVATNCPAQQVIPAAGGQGGQGGMPEPMAISPVMPGDPMMPPMLPGGGGMMGPDGMYPGPMGQMGPMGPGGPMGQGGPGGPEGPQCSTRYYGSIGYQGLMRGKMDHQTRAYQDSTANGVDTGNAYFGGPSLFDANELNPRMGSGLSAMIGKQWGSNAVELGGFYISQTTSSKVVQGTAIINAPYFNPPIGFEGDNGMFLQDDVFKATLKDQIVSGEFNWRHFYEWCRPGGPSVSTIAGIRYFDVLETYSEYFGDDDLTVLNLNGQPDIKRQATYSATTHNKILAPQLGVQMDVPLGMWLALDFYAKGAWGANFLETDIQLQRGDGLIGRVGGHNTTCFGQLYDLGANFDVFITPHCRIRAGYTAMWIMNVAPAISEMNYNLAQVPPAGTNHSGNMFFHGPNVQLQWAY